MKAVLDIRESKASFVMELLDNFSFVKVQSFIGAEQETNEIINIRERETKKEFFTNCFGMWEDRDINAETLRKQVWGIE